MRPAAWNDEVGWVTRQHGNLRAFAREALAAYEALAAHDAEQAAKAVPAGFVLVPVEVLEDAATAIGHFVSDHGWSAEDMQAMDNLDAYIARHKANAAAPTPPAPEAPPYRMTAGEVDAMNRALTRSVRFVDEAQAAPEAQQPAGQEQDERDAFEAWAISYSTIPLKRDDDASLGFTGYTEMDQTMLWDAWQAATAKSRSKRPMPGSHSAARATSEEAA